MNRLEPPRSLTAPSEDLNLWHAFLAQLEDTVPFLDATSETLEYLRHPKKIVTVSVPVRMDDGTVRFYTGYRVQHSISRGPAKGGVRYRAGRPTLQHLATSTCRSLVLAALAGTAL